MPGSCTAGARSSRLAALAIGIAALIGAVPAHANSSANTDIATPLREAQAAKPDSSATGDEQFRKLFNSWQSLDQSGVPALAAVGQAAEAGRTRLSASARAGAEAAAPLLGGVIAPMRASIPSRYPLAGLRMTSDFGMREHPILGGVRMHSGVDLASPIGAPVYATADGIVSKAEWLGGYGLLVEIEHGGNLETRYGHMSRLNVAAGQRVRKGDVIGFVGMTGRTTGPHLHYEVRVGQVAVNPVPYMQAQGDAAPTALAASK